MPVAEPHTGATADAEPQAERVLLIVADISGYTKFMLASRLAMVHGQQVITALIEALIHEIEIPLELKEIEGDAVFLYARRPADDAAWREVRDQVGEKLLRFFEVFCAALVKESEGTICPCGICEHLPELSLKVVVHSGEALFHKIDRFTDVSGVDVILVHRLLKNSVEGDEYILMTEQAHREIPLPAELPVEKSSEEYEGFGSVPIYVHRLGESFETCRERFLQGTPAEILGVTMTAGVRDIAGQFKTLCRPGERANCRKLPEVRDGVLPFLWTAFQLLLVTPVQLVLMPFVSSARALLGRRRRLAAS